MYIRSVAPTLSERNFVPACSNIVYKTSADRKQLNRENSYFTTRVTVYSYIFARLQAAQRSPLFKFSVRRGPRIWASALQLVVRFYSYLTTVLVIFYVDSYTRMTPNSHVLRCMPRI